MYANETGSVKRKQLTMKDKAVGVSLDRQRRIRWGVLLRLL